MTQIYQAEVHNLNYLHMIFWMHLSLCHSFIVYMSDMMFFLLMHPECYHAISLMSVSLMVCVDGELSLDSLSPAHTLSSVPSPGSLSALSPCSTPVSHCTSNRRSILRVQGFAFMQTKWFECVCVCVSGLAHCQNTHCPMRCPFLTLCLPAALLHWANTHTYTHTHTWVSH